MKIRILIVSAVVASLSAYSANADGGKGLSRGIGVYPGNPAEDFAPRLVRDGSYRNMARNRLVTASSEFDYNLTGQLVTDGIVSAADVSCLEVFTPQGALDRKERESAIDGGEYSRNILEGEDTWLDYRWQGYLLRADSVAVACETVYRDGYADGKWSISCSAALRNGDETVLGAVSGDSLPGSAARGFLHSDPNKQTAADVLPARRISLGFRLDNPAGTDNLKMRFSMKGAVRWTVTEIYFDREGRRIFDMLPSYRFSSVWKSAGTGLEWVETDLGAEADIDRIVLCWTDRPSLRKVEVSDDRSQWREIPAPGSVEMNEVIECEAKGRYVMVLMDGGAQGGGPYAMTELEVWGRGGLSPEPVAPPVLKNGNISLDGGEWKVQRASEVGPGGDFVSTPDFFPDGWLTATVPATVLMSYVNAGAVPDPNDDDNVNRISESFFNGDFWYRREFDAAPGDAGKEFFLCFDGINWKAEIWLNGESVDLIEGAFIRGKARVSLKEHNVLAVKIIGNKHIGAVKEKTALTTGFNGGILGADNPTFHASIGWDWITTVRGRNSGIWNDVFLTPVKPVRLSDPLVTTTLSPDGKASVTASVMVESEGDGGEVEISGWIGDRKFSKKVRAGFCGELKFTPEEFAVLRGQEMKLWWPNGYGEPYLYDAGFRASEGGKAVDELSYKAGIREVTWKDENTALKLYVNGRRFIPLGGNWGFSEHNLRFRGREYAISVDFHRQMNCNMIRNWVGQTGDEEFYEACDSLGIMVWQDFWLANPADGPDPYYEDIFCRNARDYALRIRRHPSIAIYCGRNEGYPPETIDKYLRHNVVAALHPGIPYIPSSADDGVSGHGPYRAMTPEYYFEHQSGKLHSESGMPNVPTYESLSRMMPPESLWPQGDLWGKHDYTLEGAQGARSFNEIISKAFGEPSSAREFTALAQWVNYDGYRAMYESGSKDRMGLLIWMSHSCWPSMTWCAYDYYFEPTGAFFGIKKACEPLHIQLNASTSDIEVVNVCAGDRDGLKAAARVYDYKGKLISADGAVLSSAEDSTTPCMKLRVPGDEVEVYYVKLSLHDRAGNLLSDNFYIQGREPGNYRAVRSLPEAKVKKTVKFSGETAVVTLRNTGKVPALLLRLTLKASDGEEILPVDYSDNYFSLMPGESRPVTVRWNSSDARGLSPEISISGLNMD